MTCTGMRVCASNISDTNIASLVANRAKKAASRARTGEGGGGGVGVGFCTLCFSFPTKMLHLNVGPFRLC